MIGPEDEAAMMNTPTPVTGPTYTPEQRAEQQAELDMWREATEHWENVDAFVTYIDKLNDDSVYTQKETQEFCDTAPQWLSKMNAATAYINAYEEVNAELVHDTPRLWKLRRDAGVYALHIEEYLTNC